MLLVPTVRAEYVKPVDISDLPELRKLAEEVQRSHEPRLDVQIVTRAGRFDRSRVAVSENACLVPVPDLALGVQLMIWRDDTGLNLKSGEGRQNGDIGQILWRDGAELLRVT